jgi:exodeoxyribonuclease-3
MPTAISRPIGAPSTAYGFRARTNRSPRSYRALTTDHGLVDAFRHLHPTDREYSWVGRTGDGYRYDHALCSTSLQAAIRACRYDHRPRADRLSDHSALALHLDIHAPATLTTGDPRTSAEPATLF